MTAFPPAGASCAGTSGPGSCIEPLRAPGGQLRGTALSSPCASQHRVAHSHQPRPVRLAAPVHTSRPQGESVAWRRASAVEEVQPTATVSGTTSRCREAASVGRVNCETADARSTHIGTLHRRGAQARAPPHCDTPSGRTAPTPALGAGSAPVPRPDTARSELQGHEGAVRSH